MNKETRLPLQFVVKNKPVEAKFSPPVNGGG
jgi:hypothetical protein